MGDENPGRGAALHSLIPLADFKAILGLDDREGVLSRYCLITATYTIEHYCKRRLLRRNHTDYLTFTGEHIYSLREYPVRRVLAVWAAHAALLGATRFGPENLVDPAQYYCLPDEGIHEDIPFSLVVRSPLGLTRGDRGIKVRYRAGLCSGEGPGGPGLRLSGTSGLEHEPLPGAADWDDRECPGEREGGGTFGTVHAGECTAAFGTV